MPTFVVDDKLLLRDVGCVLCAFTQCTNQLVIHDKEICTHNTDRDTGATRAGCRQYSMSVSPM